MPIKECTLPGGGKGFQWGDHGKCFSTRAEAERQAAAAHANGFVGDTVKFGLDATPSARYKDESGNLHVSASNISKATVNPYYGREIPKWQELGLSPDRVYYLYRDPVELERAAPTFARLPILDKHIPTFAAKPNKENRIGTIGSDIRWDAPYLVADMTFWDADAIEEIEDETIKELSCGYFYDADMTPGTTPDGTAYDGRITNIRGNHLAKVESGRAGADVVVADSNPFAKGKPMKMTALGRALFAGLRGVSPKLAMDAALPGLVASARAKTLDRAKLKKSVMALDEDLEGEKVDDVIDTVLGIQDEPEPVEPAIPPGPKTPAAGKDAETVPEPGKKDKLSALLKGKVDDETLASCLGLVGDEDGDDEGDTGVEQAMDGLEKKLRAQFMALDSAKSDVRELLGEVRGVDTAAGVYELALDHLKVDHKGITDEAALRALFNVANKPAPAAPKQKARLGMDEANKSVEAKHPGLARFGI